MIITDRIKEEMIRQWLDEVDITTCLCSLESNRWQFKMQQAFLRHSNLFSSPPYRMYRFELTFEHGKMSDQNSLGYFEIPAAQA